MVNLKHKRKKVVKYRGSNSHGGGAKKKRRGAGHRGGRGNAGSGKRGDSKAPTYSKIENYFGKYGFINPNPVEIKAINIDYFEQHMGTLAAKGLIDVQGNNVVVDLTKLKCNKLLGSGIPTKKYKIKAVYASESAVEKIKKAGGEVILPPKKEKPVAKAQAEAAEE